MLRRRRRHNIRDRHLPSRYRPHSTIDPICLLQRSDPRTSGEEASGHVGNIKDHVHNRGRSHSFVSGHHTHSRGRGTLRWLELHGLRECTTVLHSRGSAESLRDWKVERRSHLRCCGSDHHISFVSLIPSKLTRLTRATSLTHANSDVLRRRFQINTMTGMGYQYKSIFDAVRTITAQEGLRGMYKGIVPNLLKVAPSMASSWLSFELTRDFFVGLKPEAVPADEPK